MAQITFKPGDRVKVYGESATVITWEAYIANGGDAPSPRGERTPYRYDSGVVAFSSTDQVSVAVEEPSKFKPGDKVKACQGIATVITWEEYEASGKGKKRPTPSQRSTPYRYDKPGSGTRYDSTSFLKLVPKFKPGDRVKAYSGIATVIAWEEYVKDGGSDIINRDDKYTCYRYDDGSTSHDQTVRLRLAVEEVRFFYGIKKGARSKNGTLWHDGGYKIEAGKVYWWTGRCKWKLFGDQRKLKVIEASSRECTEYEATHKGKVPPVATMPVPKDVEIHYYKGVGQGAYRISGGLVEFGIGGEWNRASATLAYVTDSKHPEISEATALKRAGISEPAREWFRSPPVSIECGLLPGTGYAIRAGRALHYKSGGWYRSVTSEKDVRSNCLKVGSEAEAIAEKVKSEFQYCQYYRGIKPDVVDLTGDGPSSATGYKFENGFLFWYDEGKWKFLESQQSRIPAIREQAKPVDTEYEAICGKKDGRGDFELNAVVDVHGVIPYTGCVVEHTQATIVKIRDDSVEHREIPYEVLPVTEWKYLRARPNSDVKAHWCVPASILTLVEEEVYVPAVSTELTDDEFVTEFSETKAKARWWLGTDDMGSGACFIVCWCRGNGYFYGSADQWTPRSGCIDGADDERALNTSFTQREVSEEFALLTLMEKGWPLPPSLDIEDTASTELADETLDEKETEMQTVAMKYRRRGTQCGACGKKHSDHGKLGADGLLHGKCTGCGCEMTMKPLNRKLFVPSEDGPMTDHRPIHWPWYARATGWLVRKGCDKLYRLTRICVAAASLGASLVMTYKYQDEIVAVVETWKAAIFS